MRDTAFLAGGEYTYTGAVVQAHTAPLSRRLSPFCCACAVCVYAVRAGAVLHYAVQHTALRSTAHGLRGGGGAGDVINYI